MADYHRRTAITRLQVTPEQARLLEETTHQFKEACQLAVEKVWPECSAKRRVQSLAYDAIRESTALGSQHSILATQQAATAIAACKSRSANGYAVSKPSFTAPTLRYDTRTMTLFDDGSVSLSTIDSRVRCSLVLPTESDGYQNQFLTDDAWELTESTLTRRDGGWYLHLGFRRLQESTESSTAENGTVLGVDLGIENLAVTSTGKFFSGRELTHVREQFEQQRRELQQVGTRSAYRTLQSASTRERRFAQDLLHRVANGIIREAVAHECSAIAFENLTGIASRLSNATVFHTWAFRCLREYVSYKAATVGIDVCTVDPSYTSRQCSRTDCENVDSANRPTQPRFHCQRCGYEVHADYNAAKNIGLRAVRDGHKTSSRTGASQCALKSGTITPDGEFSPIKRDERQSTDKSGLDRPLYRTD